MFKNITLELGLKPFKKTDSEYIHSVCEKVFTQWQPLLKDRESISILLWASDGSEILDYTGDLDKSFEWCCYIGTANKELVGDMPPETSLHERKQFYMENPPVMTYRILKNIISELKAVGRKLYPKSTIRIGATFDIGPEFAISDFKYNRHREVCKGSGCDNLGFVDATAFLKGDDYPYAAYPDGVPENTPMGTLLGAQSDIYLRDMGFDYIWLSNGMGFCYEPWNSYGKIYDGEKFYPEKLEKTKENIFLFWKLFRETCKDFPIETRGTNFSVGIDYACDGVPLHDIYSADLNITPPPNSPWAAINDDIGIEMLGHLTRNCNLPDNDYMFRFYLHDMWWLNSPWYDRYESNPYDIYIPMSLSRIDENGNTQSPSLFNILSIDNSMGDMPDSCVNEVIPHLLKAEKDAPDEIAPLVLVYPMREYTTSRSEKMLYEMYFGDTFLKNALNCGFPLCSVVSTDNFVKHNPEIYSKSILIFPAAFDNYEVKSKLCTHGENGGKLISYGSADELDKLNIKCKKADISKDISQLFEAITHFGYEVKFKRANDNVSLPALTVHKNNNAFWFNMYNRSNTVETSLKFPLGAPVLNGFDTEIINGYSTYRFPKSVHAECRVFVKQNGGIVRSREQIPTNRKYRRKIEISGLENAEIYLFAESYCKDKADIATFEFSDSTPVLCKNFEVINDSENGTYLRIKNVSGKIYLCMPFRDRM